ncbi:hypothetical protein QUF61_09060 [Candidatus Venteria ishoeyi]|uniref:hypothetical protein n=1 Tax=Candidatus Venteria ishoeyi TaxID=1899563 RepID=UPI0025A54465|nr:hypothetical protein [Candidatus Venteria ishoeyi]MDM8546627.1 hypothetical protein [Candidatus Venteria ishoeyi]
MTTEAEKIALYIEANADNAAPDKDRVDTGYEATGFVGKSHQIYCIVNILNR